MISLQILKKKIKLSYKFNLIWDNLLENPLFWKFFMELYSIKKKQKNEHFLDFFSQKIIFNYLLLIWININYYISTINLKNLKKLIILNPTQKLINFNLPNFLLEYNLITNLKKVISPLSIILYYYTFGYLYNKTLKQLNLIIKNLQQFLFIFYFFQLKFLNLLLLKTLQKSLIN